MDPAAAGWHKTFGGPVCRFFLSARRTVSHGLKKSKSWWYTTNQPVNQCEILQCCMHFTMTKPTETDRDVACVYVCMCVNKSQRKTRSCHDTATHSKLTRETRALSLNRWRQWTYFSPQKKLIHHDYNHVHVINPFPGQDKVTVCRHEESQREGKCLESETCPSFCKIRYRLAVKTKSFNGFIARHL